MVRESRAALIPHAYTDHLRGRALEEVPQPLDRGRRLTTKRRSQAIRGMMLRIERKRYVPQ